MKNLDQFRLTVRISAISVFGIIATTVYYFIWNYVYNAHFENRYIGKGQFFLVTVYFAVLLFIGLILGGSRVDELRRGEIIYYEALALIFTNLIAYVQICLIEAKLANIWGMVYIFLIQLVVLVIWAFSTFKIVHYMNPPEKMIIVYGSHLAAEIVLKMSRLKDRYIISESVSVDEGFDEIVSRFSKYDSVVICDVPARMRNDILKYCYQNNINIYVVPKISDIVIKSAHEITFFDAPLMKCNSSGLTVEQKVLKRIFDVVFSFLALVILSPLFAVISIAIKLYDGGPVFYKQKRNTLGLKEFDILKFRSMIVDAEKNGPQPATDHDSRITPVGRIIRATRFDELPQLINILKGDMSVVGPRPERVEHVEKYSKEVPEFVCRYKVKGGLTGYAQVFGKYNTSAYNKIKMDLIYIQNYSFALDMKIIIMTLKILFDKESTEGFNSKGKTK